MDYNESYDIENNCYVFKFDNIVLHVYIDSITDDSATPDTRNGKPDFVKDFMYTRYGVHVVSDGFGYQGQCNNEKYIVDVI